MHTAAKLAVDGTMGKECMTVLLDEHGRAWWEVTIGEFGGGEYLPMWLEDDLLDERTWEALNTLGSTLTLNQGGVVRFGRGEIEIKGSSVHWEEDSPELEEQKFELFNFIISLLQRPEDERLGWVQVDSLMDEIRNELG